MLRTFCISITGISAYFCPIYISSQGRKFAKPELKSIIEEFEEKIDKCYNEKKEQVVTEKKAQAHQQKVKTIESFVATKKEVEESGDSEGRCSSAIYA